MTAIHRRFGHDVHKLARCLVQFELEAPSPTGRCILSRIFGDSRQVGIVVKDIDEGMNAATERLGVGPFFVIRTVEPTWFKYRGQDSRPPLLSLAFAFSGPLQLEIVQQHDDAPSAYREFLDRGRQGPQHLSSWATSSLEYEAACASARSKGAEAVHEGQIGSGRFTYFDTVEPTLGLCFEIAETMIPALVPLWERAAEASARWDGSEPVRDFAVLR